jgi:hypothetical protein
MEPTLTTELSPLEALPPHQKGHHHHQHHHRRAPLRPNIDLNGIHRDLAGYYRAFGMFDTSTPDALFERVVWPNVIRRQKPPTPASAAMDASSASRSGGQQQDASTNPAAATCWVADDL